MRGVGAAEGLLAGFGEAEGAHLPLVDERGHGAHDVLDRYRSVDAVLIEEIDAVRLEPAQRALNGLADVRGPAVRALEGALLVELEPELGRDHHAIALSLQRAGQQLLV